MRTVLKRMVLFLIGGALFILLLIPLRTYGTLNPCGWLKFELEQAMLLKASRTNTKSGSAAVGTMLGLPESSASMNRMVDAMQPDECLKKVYQMSTQGGVEAYMKAKLEEQPSVLETAKKKVEWHRQEKGVLITQPRPSASTGF